MSIEQMRLAKAVTQVTGQRYCRDGQHHVAAESGSMVKTSNRAPERFICNACQERRNNALRKKK